MCWEHEEKYTMINGYGICFDHVWGLDVIDGIKDLLKHAGVNITNQEQCKEEFFELLSKWHEQGLIKPAD